MRICLLTPGLPAPRPVAEYARRLAERHEVVTALTELAPPAAAEGVVPVAQAVAGAPFDVAVATEWTGTAHLFAIPATRRAFWVDHFAHRRMGDWQAERFAAQLAYDLPVDFLAAAPWVRETLADLRPESRCLLVTSGPPDGPDSPAAATPGGPAATATDRRPAPPVDGPGGPAAATTDGPLRVHLAGDGDERAAFEAMDAPAAAVGLGDGPDVVLMLSAVDGVLGAPLAGFRAGATAVVGPAADAADLVTHGENGFVVAAGDVGGAARSLDLLARDRALLARLREAARATGAAWPTWDQAAAEMEAALERIVAEDPPEQAAWPIRLMGDAIGGAAVFRQEIGALTAEVHRVEGDDAYKVAVRVREKWRTTRLGPMRRVLAAVARRAKARLTG